MEWQGINLSAYREEKWLAKIKAISIKMLLSVLLLIVVFFYLVQQNYSLSREYQQMTQELEQIKIKYATTKNQILTITQNNQNIINIIESKMIEDFIDYLSSIKLNGILENIQLYFEEDQPILKLNGVVNQQTDFTELEQQLKQRNEIYQIENFQTNAEQHIEFSLSFKMQEE